MGINDDNINDINDIVAVVFIAIATDSTEAGKEQGGFRCFRVHAACTSLCNETLVQCDRCARYTPTHTHLTYNEVASFGFAFIFHFQVIEFVAVVAITQSRCTRRTRTWIAHAENIKGQRTGTFTRRDAAIGSTTLLQWCWWNVYERICLALDSKVLHCSEIDCVVQTQKWRRSLSTRLLWINYNVKSEKVLIGWCKERKKKTDAMRLISSNIDADVDAGMQSNDS